MLHSTLSALLVSVASRYAKLSPADVGIGIGGGRLVLDNVQLRADTLNGPHIPFHVQHGRAGRLRVNVPWGALSSNPVQVYLENVHLIAAPKTSSDSHALAAAISTSPAVHDPWQPPWHQTNVGRLLFNVSVEIYGLKIEYRDPHCIGIISVASLRAFSAGPDWKHHFVSLVPDLDRDQPDATAVAMRKTVTLSGVHFVMIPRAKQRTPPSSSASGPDALASAEAVGRVGDPTSSEPDGTTRQNSHPDNADRNLDLASFESKSPILDGASISLRVLFCTGATVLPSQPNHLSPGLHGEVFVEIDEPTVKLTARQLVWLDHILKQGLGIAAGQNAAEAATKQGVKRRPRSAGEGEYPADDVGSGEGEYARGHNATTEGDAVDKAGDGADVGEELSTRTMAVTNGRRRHRASGGLRSVWEAIISENSDDTVDDAAIALGLWNGYEEDDAVNGVAGVQDLDDSDDGVGEVKRRDASWDANSVDEGDNEEEEDEVNANSTDQQYARRAVATAAECGGVTWQVRVKTTDNAAWERVEVLERQVAEGLRRAEEAEGKLNAVESAGEGLRATEDDARMEVEQMVEERLRARVEETYGIVEKQREMLRVSEEETRKEVERMVEERMRVLEKERDEIILEQQEMLREAEAATLVAGERADERVRAADEARKISERRAADRVMEATERVRQAAEARKEAEKRAKTLEEENAELTMEMKKVGDWTQSQATEHFEEKNVEEVAKAAGGTGLEMRAVEDRATTTGPLPGRVATVLRAEDSMPIPAAAVPLSVPTPFPAAAAPFSMVTGAEGMERARDMDAPILLDMPVSSSSDETFEGMQSKMSSEGLTLI